MLVYRHASMENKVFLSPKMHSSMRDHPSYLIPELLAGHERTPDAFQTKSFLTGEFVWVVWIDGGKIDV
jgi:hypothetical protein